MGPLHFFLLITSWDARTASHSRMTVPTRMGGWGSSLFLRSAQEKEPALVQFGLDSYMLLAHSIGGPSRHLRSGLVIVRSSLISTIG